MTRRFSLSNLFDRSEWDSLVDAAFPGFDLLRGQLLAPDGRQLPLEASAEVPGRKLQLASKPDLTMAAGRTVHVPR